MSYETIDPTITEWAAQHGLHIFTKYRDEEVRSMDLVGPNGRKCQLWIDTPDPSGNVGVHVWDYKKRRKDFRATTIDLAQRLEDAYVTAISWLN